MANVVGKNPMKIDTAGSSPFWQNQALIDHFELTGYAVATDVITVTDSAGDIVWQAQGNADIAPIQSGFIGWVLRGLYVTAGNLPPGATLLVYLGHPR